MSYLQSELTYRELPSLLTHTDGTTVTSESWPRRRKELLEILYQNSYGRTPAAPEKVWAEVLREDKNAYAGKAVHRYLKLCFDTPKGVFSFPVNLFLPYTAEKAPVFIHINFRPDVPDKYCPVEEIIDNGFALAVFCYEDVIADSHDGNFDQGLGAMFRDAGVPRMPDEWGKIGMWAYACSRVLDWLILEDEVDWRHAAVVGHSKRLSGRRRRMNGSLWASPTIPVSAGLPSTKKVPASVWRTSSVRAAGNGTAKPSSPIWTGKT